MATLAKLPVELLGFIAGGLDNAKDLAHLAQSCRDLHAVANQALYRSVKDDVAIACWAADECCLGTMKHWLAAGADPNVAWVQNVKRSETLRFCSKLHLISQPVRLSRATATRHEYPTNTPTNDGNLVEQPRPDPLDMVNGARRDSEANSMTHDGDSHSHVGGRDLGVDVQWHSRAREVMSAGSNDYAHEYYWTPLSIAARWGDNAMVQLLLCRGANPNSLSRGFCDCQHPDRWPYSYVHEQSSEFPLWKPLHTALCHGHESTAQLLLRHGASINVATKELGSNENSVTALHAACGFGMLSMIRFLVEHNYQDNVNVQDHAGRSPLVYAFEFGEWRVIDLLLELGADIDFEISYGTTLLLIACLQGRFREALRFLELGANVHRTEPRSGQSALHMCCAKSIMWKNIPLLHPCISDPVADLEARPKLVSALLKAGAAVDLRAETQETPFIFAAHAHAVKEMEIMLDAGADINAVDHWNQSGLVRAAMYYKTENLLSTVRLLLDRGAHVDQRGKDGLTALHILCQEYHDDPSAKASAVRLLVELGGANPNCPEPDSGITLLQSVFGHGLFDICDVLLRCGAEQPTPTVCEHMLRRITLQDDACSLMFWYKNFHNARPLITSKSRLFDAIKGNNRDISKVFFAAGSPSDYRADDGSTCLYWACVHGDAFMAKALLESGSCPNQITRQGDSPSRAAARSNGEEIVRLLLQHKANKEDMIEEILCGYGNGDCWDEALCRHLLEDADAHRRGQYLRKACTRVMNEIRYEPLRFLLKAGVDPNLPLDDTGEPPLCFILQNKLPEKDAELYALDILLSAGADIYRKFPVGIPNAAWKGNDTGYTTPLEWALNTECVSHALANMLIAQPLKNQTAAEIDVYVTCVCQTLNFWLLRVMVIAGQLDLDYQDEKGNVMMTKICLGLEYIKIHGRAGMRRADQVVAPFILSLDMLREEGSNPRIRNREGRCPVDFFRGLASYSGPDKFYQELSQYIRMDGDKLVLTSHPDIRPRS